MEFTNYYICGSTGSGKTWLVYKWLERMEEKNGIKLDYSGSKEGVMRMDDDWSLRHKLKGYKDKYIALYENFIPSISRGYRDMVPSLNMNGILAVFLTVCPIEESSENVKKMIEENKFRVINMDKEKRKNEAVEQTVNRVLETMDCPKLKERQKYFMKYEKDVGIPEVKPKVYITSNAFIISVLRSAYDDLTFRLDRSHPMWKGYKGEPIVLYEPAFHEYQWIRKLPQIVTKSKFGTKNYPYEKRITIIAIREEKVFNGRLVQQFIKDFDVEILDMEQLRDNWNYSIDFDGSPDCLITDIMNKIEQQLSIPYVKYPGRMDRNENENEEEKKPKVPQTGDN